MKIYLVCFLSAILLLFCYDCQDLRITPSPIAEVMIGQPLTLTCIYTGNNTPVIVKWFLDNDTIGMIISKTTCLIIGTPGTAYEVSRYAINCSQLTINTISENDIEDQWGCTVAFTLGTSPLVSSTVIKKAVSTTTPKPNDQSRLGLGICSVIKIIGCIISIVFLALKGYQLSLGLGICFGIIILACIICIIILGCVKNGDYLRLGHCICFAIIIVVCISCIVILTKNGVECPQNFLIGLGIGFGILIIVCIISILILVFFKKVIIQNKDTSPRTDEKEVTISAIIYGLWISVEWIKGKTVLETNGDFTIKPYDNYTRKSFLIIKSSSLTNSATYICRAKNRCGCCSAEDSITLPHDKDKPTTGKAEQSEGSEMQMRRRS